MTDHRGSARKRGYTWQWEKARAAFLAEPDHLFCIECQKIGLLNPGTLRMDGSPETNSRRIGLRIDHIIPHKGDQRLFWDRSNWQQLCSDHHDIVKQRLEQGAAIKGAVGIDGRPKSLDHPWNKAQK